MTDDATTSDEQLKFRQILAVRDPDDRNDYILFGVTFDGVLYRREHDDILATGVWFPLPNGNVSSTMTLQVKCNSCGAVTPYIPCDSTTHPCPNPDCRP